MIYKRQKLIEQSISSLENENVLLLQGGFGTGKTTLSRLITNELLESKKLDGIFQFSDLMNLNYAEFIFNLALNFRDNSNDDYPLQAEECALNQSKYAELISNLEKVINPNLLEQINELNTFYYDPLGEIESIEIENGQLNIEKDLLFINKLKSIVVESLIVDLIYKYYPINDENSSLEQYILSGEKKSILVVIDNYDPIKNKLEKYFETIFMDYCFNKKFSEFFAYDLSSDNQIISVADLFDFKFLFLSRKKFKSSLIKENNLIQIDNFSDDELLKYLLQKGLDKETYYNDFLFITKGNPFIVSVLIESIETNASSFDMLKIYNLCEEIIFQYYAEDQKNWIKAVSFFNDFDEFALKLIPEFKDHTSLIYNFLKTNDDIFEEYNSKLKMKSMIKEYINTSMNFNSKSYADDLISISVIYDKVKPLIESNSKEEFDLLLFLSFYNNFNFEYLFSKYFPEKRDIIEKYVEKNKQIFNKHKFSYSLEENIKNDLLLYNKYSDPDIYQSQKDIVKSNWQEYLQELNDRKNEYKNEIKNIFNDMDKIKSQTTNYNEELTDKQNTFISLENQLLNLNKKLKPFVSYKNNFMAIIILISAILFLIIGLFSHIIFEELFRSNNTITYTSTISLILSSLLFILSSKSVFRWVRSYLKKEDIKKWKIELDKTIKYQTKLKDELSIKNADLIANNAKIEELNLDIYNINKMIEEVEIKKLESFE